MQDRTSGLRAVPEAAISDDLGVRRLYAQDASPFQCLPGGVARPQDREAMAALVRFAAEHGLGLIPRGAGTSLAGQCVGDGIVIDTYGRFDRIRAIDSRRRLAQVEPGVVLADLNTAAAGSGLMFGPDPSTGDRATLGGMVGNNAWGAHALRYGTTRDHVVAAEAILADGSAAQFGPLDPAAALTKCQSHNLEGAIYRALTEVVGNDADSITTRYPSVRGIPNNAGYPLDVLAAGRPWRPDGADLNVAPFLCGSEGTLAIITGLTLRLVPRPASRSLLCAQFVSLEAALEAVATAKAAEPAAIELLDRRILGQARNNPVQRHNRFWLRGDPAAALLIEFHGETQDAVRAAATDLQRMLRDPSLAYACDIIEREAIERVWALRRAGLGLLMGVESARKPVTGMEDCAVPVAALPAYVSQARELFTAHGLDCVVYGSVGMGLVHLRPEMDLGNGRERALYPRLVEAVGELAISHGGTPSAKHGDGRLRSALLNKLYGPELVARLQSVKQAFDPQGILNPGKVLSSPPLDEGLRVPPGGTGPPVQTGFRWSAANGWVGASEHCQGAGVCLKTTGAMCPSYQVTRDEQHATRGRANLLRQALRTGSMEEILADRALAEALDLCLACKSCRAECPANVDMARLKAEYLHALHERSGIRVATRIRGEFGRLARLASVWPRMANALLGQRLVKRWLSIHPQRTPAPFAPVRLSQWLRGRRDTAPVAHRGEVFLLNDPFSEYLEPHIGTAAERVLTAVGYRVRLTPFISDVRPMISAGLLHRARGRLARLVPKIAAILDRGTPIVGLEPSELLVYRDEAPDLVPTALGAQARRIAQSALLFEEFVLARCPGLPEGRRRAGTHPRRLLVHVHCHQRALSDAQTVLQVLRLTGHDVGPLPAQCCGMAGAFGYEPEHFDLSCRLGRALLDSMGPQGPQGRQGRQGRQDGVLVATGTSCRQQFRDIAGIHPWHPAEILATALARSKPSE
jgi:FAD/FMN-containing dehydrogenase/Fe-S oxidoreductase